MSKTEDRIVREYIVGLLDYARFRVAHMARIDGHEERLWSRVESACAHFDVPGEIQGAPPIDEQELKLELIDILVCYQPWMVGDTGTENTIDLNAFHYTVTR